MGFEKQRGALTPRQKNRITLRGYSVDRTIDIVKNIFVRILVFCVSELRKSVPRSVPLNMDSWAFCPFFTARSLFSTTSHTAADFARQVD